ncbi:MAG: bifunctional [glutamate--ammonia ligase]-adenylyl-L-tyrosine phosphorylase/[glutamate--ammonia-ligase] adenylyltransferase, partial [Burkholderiales bacterium]
MPIPEKPAAAATCAPGPLIARARALSRFAQRLLEREPQLEPAIAQSLHQPFTLERMRAHLDDPADIADLQRTLRRLRARVMLHLLTRDLGGVADLGEVMRTTTQLAETTLDFAVTHLYRWLQQEYGAPIGKDSGTPQPLLVIGMGKLGGGELN